MTRNDFVRRKAKRGYGARRSELMRLLWQADNDVGHYAILGQATKMEQAKRDRSAYIAELLEITHEAQDEDR